MKYLGIEKDRAKLISNDLNLLLSNYHVYYQNLRNFHWNIKGENFFELHNQFEALYNDARLKIDQIAERILTLGNAPVSAFSSYLKMAEIKESKVLKEDRKMVTVILKNHEALIKNLRKVIKHASEAKDEGTIDMAAGFLEKLEKISWMLEAWSTRKN